MTKISPSLLACDFSRIGEEVAEIESAGAEYLHLDVMDGIFVPNISFGFSVISSIRSKSEMVFDVHLMVAAPERYIEASRKSGAGIITFHYEATRDPVSTILKIREAGCLPSVSVKPGTPVSVLYPYLDLLDMVLIMTVEPGYGGQKLIPETVGKVCELHAEIEMRGLHTEIEVDGGVTAENAPSLISAGADVLVAGSSVFRAKDRRAAICSLRSGAVSG